MPTTTATGLPVPTSGDAPNVPADMLALGGALDLVTVPLFASTSARDTAYAAKPFGLCFVGPSVDAGTLYRRVSGAWLPVTDIAATYTPVVTAGTTSPTGYTAEGRYVQSGRVVSVRFMITFGSALGSNFYMVSLPVAPNSSWENKGFSSYGTCVITNGTATAYGQCRIYTGSRCIMQAQTSFTAHQNVSSTQPIALSSGSVITGSLTYEAA